MKSHFLISTAAGCVAAMCLLAPAGSCAQGPASGGAARPEQSELTRSHLVVYVRDASGAPVSTLAMVTLTRMANQYWQQMTAQGGQANFDNVMAGRYSVQVIAAGYQDAMEEVDIVGGGGGESVYVAMRPNAKDSAPTPVAPGPPLLAPKAQKELGKALEALREGKLPEARKHLDAALRLAPTHPDVNYLFGIYSTQMNDWREAEKYWMKAVEFYPQHVPAQVSLGDALLRENKAEEAAAHLKKALEADPNSWRAHAFLADAELRMGSPEQAVKDAEQAIKLGHERAAPVRPLLARALAAQGNRERAIQILEMQVRESPSDKAAQRELSALRTQQMMSRASRSDSAEAGSSAGHMPDPAGVPATKKREAIPAPVLGEPPVPSNWLPPDIDEKVPPVEAGVPCALNEVIEKAGKRVQEFVHSVDHFTATESLLHETVLPWGLMGAAEKRKFSYVASIQEVRPGILSVSEYRDGRLAYNNFPEGIATLGLPALVLIFHPYHAANYDMRCEGLARWEGRLAWQVRFQQRADKPIRDRVYRFGDSGVSHPVALKGRAWIAADTYQIVRLETDIVAPLPEIRLLADRTILDYGAVHFSKDNVDLWLPKRAEVFSDRRGRRYHRVHSFSDYMLFSVGDRQKMSAPKSDDTPPANAPARTDPE